MDARVILFGAGAGIALAVGAAYVARRAAPSLNPLNPANVFASGANAVTEALTGDPSFGGWLCDVFGPCREANEAMRAPVAVHSDGHSGGARPLPQLSDLTVP